MLGCCLVSLYFLWGKLSTRTVHVVRDILGTVKRPSDWVAFLVHYLFHCRDDLEDFLEVGVYGGKMSASVPLNNYKIIVMSASQDMAEAEIEVMDIDFLERSTTITGMTWRSTACNKIK